MIERWYRQAACRGQASTVGNYKTFFPAMEDKLTTMKAKALCAGCPVTQQCLDYAMVHEIPDGVWGGMAFAERETFGRRRRLRVV